MGCRHSQEIPEQKTKKKSRAASIITSMHKVTFYYNSLSGWTDTIQALLHFINVPFTCQKLTEVECEELKKDIDFNKLPMLEFDEYILEGARPILQFIARYSGLYPFERFEIYKLESLLDFLDDLYERIPAVKASEDSSLNKFMESEMPQKISLIEQRLLSNIIPDFFIGDRTTLADVAVVAFLYNLFLIPARKHHFQHLLECYTPTLKSFMDSFLDRSPNTRDYLSNRSGLAI